MIRRPPGSTLFPCTTLSRSAADRSERAGADDGEDEEQDRHHDTPDRHDIAEEESVLRPAGKSGAPCLWRRQDRKSTRLNSSHANISYAVFCLKKKNQLTPLH